MKGFFTAAFAALIAGIAVLLFQQFILPKMAGESQRAQVALVGRIPISRDQADSLSEWFTNPKELTSLKSTATPEFHLFEIRNFGTNDLQNLSIEFDAAGDNLSELLFAKMSQPQHVGTSAMPINEENWSDLPFDARNSGFSFQIPLIKRGEFVRVASLGTPVLYPRISVRSKDVEARVGENSQVFDQIDRDPIASLNWLIVPAFILASFLFGIGLSEYFHREALAKIGFDYTEVMKLYQEAMKKNG